MLVLLWAEYCSTVFCRWLILAITRQQARKSIPYSVAAFVAEQKEAGRNIWPPRGPESLSQIILRHIAHGRFTCFTHFSVTYCTVRALFSQSQQIYSVKLNLQTSPTSVFVPCLILRFSLLERCIGGSVRTKLSTCFAGHSHHAFLLLPEADVVLERQEVKEELRKQYVDRQYTSRLVGTFIIWPPVLISYASWKVLLQENPICLIRNIFTCYYVEK